MKTASYVHPLALVACATLATPLLGASPVLGPSTIATAAPLVLSAKLTSRLRSSGLDPASPNLHADLVRLASQKAQLRKGPALAVHAGMFQLTPRPTFAVEPPSPAVLQAILNTPVITKVTFGNVIDVQGYNYTVPGFDVQPASGSLTLAKCGPPEVLQQKITGADLTFARDRYVVSPTPGTMTITVKGHTSAPVSFTVAPVSPGPDFSADYGVNTDPGLWEDPHAGAFDLGFTGSSFQTTDSASRISTDVTGAESSGVDTIGYGVNLVNGWTATASLSDIYSYRDGPQSQAVSDDFRSATIVQQPQNGRLETKIAWKFEPGESLTYWVTWTFHNGTMGARPVDSMAKLTGCSDEQ